MADGQIELTSSGTTLLQDALYVLTCDEIRLGEVQSTTKDGEDEDDGNAGGEMAVAEAIHSLVRKTIVSQVC